MDPQTSPLPPSTPAGIPPVTKLPTAASLYGQPKKQIWHWVVIAVLAVFSMLFAVLFGLQYQEATKATTTLNEQKAAAAKAAREEQKAADDLACLKAAESPFRSITVPQEFGAFTVSFPKNWSASASYELTDQKQVEMYLHPDLVLKKDRNYIPMGAYISLRKQSLAEFLQTYNNMRGVKQVDYTVDGIKGKELTGTFNDKLTKRIVVVPVRDKVLAFFNSNATYANEFSQILADVNIVP